MTTFSVKHLQERYGVGEHTVLGWIKHGELEAINICRVGSRRPKWRVTQEALDQFESRRMMVPPQPRAPRRSKAATPALFYK